ncbi:MAG: tandem-95 repeat protein, partial [Planctomycetota bacterium]
GTDTFTYTLSDGNSTDEVTVTVTVTSPDNPPTANDDAFPVSGGAAINEDSGQGTYDVTANDVADVDGQTFSIESVGTPSGGGDVTVSQDGGSLLYQPAANFNGTETVAYTIRDTGGGLSTATATFTVTAVNDPPPITNISRDVLRGEVDVVIATIADMGANVDIGENVDFVNLSTPSNGGVVSVSADGQRLLYTPAPDYSGSETFTFEVQDEDGLTSGPATVTISVRAFQTRDVMVQFDRDLSPEYFNLQTLSLTGTDALGNQVTINFDDPSVTVTDGRIEVADLLPGSYSVNIPAVPFFQGSEVARQIPFESEETEGDEMVDISIGRIHPEYISVRDWYFSAPRSAVVAVVSAGEAAMLTQPSESAETQFDDLEIEMDADGENIVVRAARLADAASNTTAADVEGTLAVQRGGIADIRAIADGSRLVVINLDDNSVLPETSAASGEPVAPASQPATDDGTRSPAGEPIVVAAQQASSEVAPAVVDSASVNDAFVPAALPQDAGNSPTTTDSSDDRDQALADVGPELTRVSQTESVLAEDSDESVKLFTDAVDTVLTSDELG